MRILIVGGGILGTAHADEAIRRGHDVIHLEREPEAAVPRYGTSASSGYPGEPPHELEAALRSRELWADLAARVPGVGYRPAGSITLMRTEEEVAVAQEAFSRPDADNRGFALLDPDAVRVVNPALRGGKFLGGLHCTLDAAVESRQALPRHPFLPRIHWPLHLPRRNGSPRDHDDHLRRTHPRRPRSQLRRRSRDRLPPEQHSADWLAISPAISRCAVCACR